MIKQFVPQDICLKCRVCCRFKEEDSVWTPCLLDEEVQVLLDKKDLPPTLISIDRKIQAFPNPDGGGFVCAFFDTQNNKCKIYDLRPFECQLYPFLINMRGKKIFLTIDLNCPYIKDKLQGKEFREYVDYLVSFLNSPAQIKLLKENPQILKAYDEISEVAELKISDEAQ